MNSLYRCILRAFVTVGVLTASMFSVNALALQCNFTTNDWGNGFSAEITITNDSSSSITGWNVTWQLNGGSQVSGSWNANVSGTNPYTASNVDWNGNLSPGSSTSFGILGNGDNSTGTILSCVSQGNNTSTSSPSSSRSSSSSYSSSNSSSSRSSSSVGSGLSSSSSLSSLLSTFILEENTTGFCSVNGTIDSNYSGYSGSGFANTTNTNGSSINYAIAVPATGNYTVYFDYANGSTARSANLIVNASATTSFTFNGTGGWNTWVNTNSVNITLQAGNNLLQLQATNSGGLANIDNLVITGVNPAAGNCNGNVSSISSRSSSSSSLSSSSRSSSLSSSFSSSRSISSSSSSRSSSNSSSSRSSSLSSSSSSRSSSSSSSSTSSRSSSSSSSGIYPNYNINPLAPDMSGMNSNAMQLASRIRLGWNIGNTMEAIGGETIWGNPLVTNELIRAVKAGGFDAIRIPISWNQYANQTTAEINLTWLNRVKEVVQYCINNDMPVIINIHWDSGWLEQNVTAAVQNQVNAKQRAFWQQIATHLRDFDGRLIFASANEPAVETAEAMAVLNSYHQTFIDAVRETGGKNAYRVLVVQGPSTDIEKTNNLMATLPVDTAVDRLMVEVHFYTPYQFALMTEDASWGNQFFYWGQGNHSPSDTAHNPTWGEEATIDQLFTQMRQKFVDRGIPVVLGEFCATRRSTQLSGENLQLHLKSRAYWHNYVTRKALENGLLPFYWDMGGLGNFASGIFDRTNNTVFDRQTLDALVEGARQ